MRAARSGDVALMRLLLDAGADLTLTTRAGTTPLLFATGPARRKSDKTAIEAIGLCLDHGADINAADANGQTALHVAVTQADSIVSFLAERGAKLDVKDRQGRTPLDIALGAGDAGGGRGARGRGPAGPRESTAAAASAVDGDAVRVVVRSFQPCRTRRTDRPRSTGRTEAALRDSALA